MRKVRFRHRYPWIIAVSTLVFTGLQRLGCSWGVAYSAYWLIALIGLVAIPWSAIVAS